MSQNRELVIYPDQTNHVYPDVIEILSASQFMQPIERSVNEKAALTIGVVKAAGRAGAPALQ